MSKKKKRIKKMVDKTFSIKSISILASTVSKNFHHMIFKEWDLNNR